MQRLCIASLALAFLVACSEHPIQPSSVGPVGSYSATQFTVTLKDSTLDELADGVTITLNLSEDGTTAGSLNVPAVGAATDLTGSYAIAHDTITFTHASPTVLTLLPFRIEGDQLQGEGRVGPGTVRIILTRE